MTDKYEAQTFITEKIFKIYARLINYNTKKLVGFRFKYKYDDLYLDVPLEYFHFRYIPDDEQAVLDFCSGGDLELVCGVVASKATVVIPRIVKAKNLELMYLDDDFMPIYEEDCDFTIKFPYCAVRFCYKNSEIIVNNLEVMNRILYETDFISRFSVCSIDFMDFDTTSVSCVFDTASFRLMADFEERYVDIFNEFLRDNNLEEANIRLNVNPKKDGYGVLSIFNDKKVVFDKPMKPFKPEVFAEMNSQFGNRTWKLGAIDNIVYDLGPVDSKFLHFPALEGGKKILAQDFSNRECLYNLHADELGARAKFSRYIKTGPKCFAAIFGVSRSIINYAFLINNAVSDILFNENLCILQDVADFDKEVISTIRTTGFLTIKRRLPAYNTLFGEEKWNDVLQIISWEFVNLLNNLNYKGGFYYDESKNELIFEVKFTREQCENFWSVIDSLLAKVT